MTGSEQVRLSRQLGFSPERPGGNSGGPPVQEKPRAMSRSKVMVISLVAGSTFFAPMTGEVLTIRGELSFAVAAGVASFVVWASAKPMTPSVAKTIIASARHDFTFLDCAIIWM